MNWPQWMYRAHPTEGFFQQTLVASEAAARELGDDWSLDPSVHGFKVCPATQTHPTHRTDGLPLHEAVPETERELQTITTADIATVEVGDLHG